MRLFCFYFGAQKKIFHKKFGEGNNFYYIYTYLRNYLTQQRKMNEIKHVVFTGSKLDFVRFQAQHSVPFHLSEGEITLIAYLFLFKDKAVKQMLTDGNSKSEKSVNNYLSSLRKKGVVIGKELAPGLYLSESPSEPVPHIFTFEITK